MSEKSKIVKYLPFDWQIGNSEATLFSRTFKVGESKVFSELAFGR
jgi:hypothetical protein